MTNRPLDELLGRTPWEVLPELEGSEFVEHFRKAMELGVPSIFEHRSVVNGDWLEVRVYPTPTGVSAYTREINQHMHLERELRELRASRGDYERLFGAMSSSVAVYDIVAGGEGRPADYRLVEVNKAFEMHVGLPRDQIVGRPAWDVTPGLHPFLQRAADGIAAGERQVEFEEYCAAMGCTYEVVAYGLSPGRFATVITDISARRTDRDRARRPGAARRGAQPDHRRRVLVARGRPHHAAGHRRGRASAGHRGGRRRHAAGRPLDGALRDGARARGGRATRERSQGSRRPARRREARAAGGRPTRATTRRCRPASCAPTSSGHC